MLSHAVRIVLCNKLECLEKLRPVQDLHLPLDLTDYVLKLVVN